MKLSKLTLLTLTILTSLLTGAIGINIISANPTELKGYWYNKYYTMYTTPPDPWKLDIYLYSYYYPKPYWIYLDTSTIRLEGTIKPESTYTTRWGRDLIVAFHGPDVVSALWAKAAHMTPGATYKIDLKVTAKDKNSDTIYSGSFPIYLTIPIPMILLSQGKDAYASSYRSGYPPSKAFDGDLTTTRWASSATPATQWIYVDLGKTEIISKVKLYWYWWAYARTYSIQVSDDPAGTWTPIYSTTYGWGGTVELTVSGTGRYVRMYATLSSSYWGGYSLYEFQVYGPVPEPPPPP